MSEYFEPIDARGVQIMPGATVVYGAPVGRSIAMVEATVALADPFTPMTGRVRLTVVRRGFGRSWGDSDAVTVRPDRLLVVLALPPAGTPTEADRREEERVARRERAPWGGSS